MHAANPLMARASLQVTVWDFTGNCVRMFENHMLWFPYHGIDHTSVIYITQARHCHPPRNPPAPPAASSKHGHCRCRGKNTLLPCLAATGARCDHLDVPRSRDARGFVGSAGRRLSATVGRYHRSYHRCHLDPRLEYQERQGSDPISCTVPHLRRQLFRTIAACSQMPRSARPEAKWRPEGHRHLLQ